MLTRRSTLALLGTIGIGSPAFQRALAANAAQGPITSKMVADAEWVAGIELTEDQREAVAQGLGRINASRERIRAISLENSTLPGLVFKPYASSAASPDPRSRDRAAETPGSIDSINPQSNDDVAFASVRQLGMLLRSRKISSVELTTLYLERLRRFDQLLQCVVTLIDELAMEQARFADRELAENHDRGPLHGIPWGLKDVFSYPGFPTTWGAPQFRHRVLHEKAAVAERLEQAGAVLVAKLSTNAFAGSPGWYRGQTRNPWNARQDSSGSSAGSAVAVAAGLVGFAIGTETSGSITSPCSRCGASGLRPTFGRVSRYGCMQLCWSLDKVGPIARTIDDCALIFEAIQGADPRDQATVDRPFVWPTARELSTIRVGYQPSALDDRRDDLQVMRDLGVQLIPVEIHTLIEDLGFYHELIEGLITMESSATFEELTRRGEPRGVQEWPRIWACGQFDSANDYLKINRLRYLFMKRFDELMQSIDVLLGNHIPLLDNLGGHPKVVLPRKYDEIGDHVVPRSQMMIGRIDDESTLLRLGAAYQAALSLSRRPPLERFLAEKDRILTRDEVLDETKLYLD